jgi:hypothetical protein
MDTSAIFDLLAGRRELTIGSTQATSPRKPLPISIMRLRNCVAFLSVAVLCSAVCGCRKSANASTVVTPDAAPNVIQTAFQNADPALQSQAAKAATATRNQDPEALAAVSQMLKSPELSGEQRAALGRCLPAAISATRAAAMRGDTRAAQTLQTYNVGK